MNYRIPSRLFVLFVVFFLVGSATASDKSISKTADVSSVAVGGTVTWTLVAANTSTAGGGPFDTPNAVVTDTVPSAFSIVSASSTQGSCSVSGQQVTCSLGTLAANATVTITVITTANTGGTHTNTGFITSGSFDPDSGNNSSESMVTVTEPQADLAIEKSASPSTVTTGDAVTFTITVTNNGPDDAPGVRVGDDLSAIFTSVVATSSQGSCTVDPANVVLCLMGDLASGATATVTISTTATVPGTFSNTAAADSEITDPVSTNNSGSASVIVEDNVADVSVTKTASPTRARSGEDVVYTITVTNNGPKSAEGVKIDDTLPLGRDGGNGVEFVSVSPSDDCSHASRNVTCNIGTMASGETKTFTITTYVVNSTLLSNLVQVSSTSPSDPDPSNNFETVAVDARRGSSGGDNPESGDSADPVNVLSGEFFFDEYPDTAIPWAARLSFERYYAAFMERDGVVSNTMGPNWSHSHNWGFSRNQNFAEVRSPRGRTWGFRFGSGVWTLTGESGAYSLVETGSERFVFIDSESQLAREFLNGKLLSAYSNGFTISYSWTADQLTGISDALGNSLTLNYTAGLLSSVASSLESVSYTYTSGVLTGVSIPGGVTLTYEYAAGAINGLLTARKTTSGIARTQQVYDEAGRVTSQSDAGGGTTRFSYGSGSSEVTYADGTRSIFAHDAEGRLTGITYQDATSSQISYDANGRNEVESVNGTTLLTRDAETNLVTGVVDPLSGPMNASYTSLTILGAPFPRLSSATFGGETTVSYTYDTAGRVTGYSDGMSPNWTYEYDPNGLLLTMSSSGGSTLSHTYNANGSLASTTNEMGDVTGYQYDSAGRQNLVLHSDGTQTARQYDGAGRLVSETDGSGVITTFAYDADGQVVSTSDALNNQMRFSYDAMGRMTGIVDAEGGETTISYNAMGDVISIVDPDAGNTSFIYDAMGRITQSTLAAGITSPVQRNTAGGLTSVGTGSGSRSLVLDSQGRITSNTSPEGRNTSVVYNRMGQMTSIRRPDGASIGIERHASGSISRLTLPDGTSTAYSINSNGQVTEVTDASGGRWARSYDIGGRLNGFSTPDGASWSIIFDSMGRITSVAGPVGTTNFEYNSAGRRTGVSYPGGNSVTYAYDAAGRLMRAGSIEFTLDGRGDIIGANGISGTRGPGGRLATITLPGGQQVTYQYDHAGRLSKVQDWASGSMSFEYDTSTGRLISTGRSSGVTTSYGFDNDGMVLSIDEKKGETVLAAVSVSRNSMGNTTNAVRKLPVVINRIPREENATFNADGETTGFAYDAAGRLLADDLRSYEWDGADRLTKAGDLTLEYDGLNSVSRRGERAHLVSYLHDVPRMVTESKNGLAIWHYVYAPSGLPLFRVSEADSSRQYFHFDEIGNATIITDESGATLAGWSFDPYGAITGASGAIDFVPFLFGGGFGVLALEETDLYRMGARVYNAKRGRFLTPDPVRDMLEPQSMDPYTYASQNPLRYVDPTGSTPAEAAEGNSFWFDAGSFVNGVASAGSTLSDWVTDGFGNSGLKGFMDDIRGTKPPGGLNKLARDKTVDAAREVARNAKAGNARGATSAAQAAKGFNAEARAAANANKKVGRLGNAANIAGVALTTYEAKGRFDNVNSQMDREFDLAARQLDSRIRSLSRSLKMGTMTRERYQQLVKSALDANKSQIEAIQDGHLVDLGIEGTRYVIKSLEVFIPTPPGISVGDGFMKLGSILFGTPVPK